MQNVSRRGFLRSLVSAPAAVVAAVALPAAVAARPRTWITGERGPELMVPNTSGTVISNRDLSPPEGRGTYITRDGRRIPIRVAGYEPDPAKRPPLPKPKR